MSAAAYAAAGGLLLSIAAATGGYAYGLGTGRALQKGEKDAETVQTLTGQIDAHADLVKQANAASRDLRRAVALREQADQKTSQELSHELNATVASRAGCVFPAGVMRNIAAARDRAAQAAASGIVDALPEPAASPPADR